MGGFEHPRSLRIGDFEQVRRGARVRCVAPVADTSGGLTHELVIEGPRATVERSFADAEFTLAIDPKADKKAWDSELRPVRDHEEANQRELAALENTAAFFEKKTPPPLTAAKSVFVSLRKREPGGTKYLFKVTGFPVPVGFSFLFGLPPVCSTFGVLTPATGDQDLFLYRAWPPFGGLLAFSRFGGTTTDVVTFSVVCKAFTQFVPIYQVFGWATGICSTFTWGGTDIFG
jgi:hypothetical protein